MRPEWLWTSDMGLASERSGRGPEGSAPAHQDEKVKSSLGGRYRRLLTWILALTANALVMGQNYRSQIASNLELFPGPRGDTRLTAYLLEHWYQTLCGNAALLSPAMFYPVNGTLGRSDALLAYVLPFSGLRISGLDIFSALAVAVIALQFLNFVACFFLLHNGLGFKALASGAGALFFAFNNPKLAQSDHLQLQPLIFLLLTVLFLVLFFRDSAALSQKRAFGLLSLAAVSLNLQLLTSFYIGWFFIFWCFLFCATGLCLRQWRLYVFEILKKYRTAVSGGLLVFSLGFACFLRLYLPVVWSSGWYGFSTDYIPEFKSYFLMADGNYIWGALTGLLLEQAEAGPDWGRRVAIGLVPSLAWIGVSIYSIFLIKKHGLMARMGEKTLSHRDTGHTLYLLFALMVFATNLLALLAFQYHGHSLWKFVYLTFPGARSIRAVARFVIVMALPMAIAFAFVVHNGMQRISRSQNGAWRRGAMATLLILIILGTVEQLNGDSGQYSVSAENQRMEKLAARLPRDCSFFYVAAPAAKGDSESGFDNQNYMHDAMLISILRGVPTLNGRSGSNPPGWRLRDVLSSDYEENVRLWIERHQLKGKVCRLTIDF